MSKQKTQAWIVWFDGTHLDARIAMLMCWAMIKKCIKAIAKEH